ncbi:restriction endonuclease subunit S [Nannocystaceae bacterium ST9]
MKVSAVTWSVYQENESKTCTDPKLVNPAYFVEEGDLLFSRANTIELVGACVIVGTTTRKIMLSDKILRLRLFDEAWNKWILHVLRSPHGRKQIESLATGNQDSMRNIGQDRVRQIAIPVPPEFQQHRIVAEIEKQFTRLDAAVSTLERVKANLRRARASVLKAAVEGRLVPTEAEIARAEGRDYEPASVLLARILDERKARWPKGKKYKEPIEPAVDGLSALPQGWAWASVEQLASLVTDGDHNPPARQSHGVPYLTSKNVRNGHIILDGCSFLSDESFAKTSARYIPNAGDVIVTCVGTIGEVATVPHGLVFSADRNLAAIRLIDGTRTDFIHISLTSPRVREWLRNASGSTAQPHLYLKDLRRATVAIAPLAEQARIVAEVERRLTILDNLAATIDRRLTHCAHLRQSILKRAFEGKLVPQDPNDEPASALLARIQKNA